MAKSESAGQAVTFRVGRVKGYRRGQVWYLCYFENGRRRRPRVGPEASAARQLAAQINGQLEVGAPAALSFEPISLSALRDRWLHHHEQVRRSSLATIRRYRTATDHLLRFLEQRPVCQASHFRVCHAEEFVAYLRSIRVAPNGHPHAARRPLLDKGILFILESCRALFVFAAKRRHLPPYAENPFSALELGRIPGEHRRPIRLPTRQQLALVLERSADWSFSIFVTLALTGMRPGELVHLLAEDFDPQEQLLHIRNRPALGWQIKTRQDRTIPLLDAHSKLLLRMVEPHRKGTLFHRQHFSELQLHPWSVTAETASAELQRRGRERELVAQRPLTRQSQAGLCQRLWWELGMVKTDTIRTLLRWLSKKMAIFELDTPKVFRHFFATTLQEGRVDPLIRNELLGHIPEDGPRIGGGLGMTANYTHTRIETKRDQLTVAWQNHPLQAVLNQRLQSR